MSNDRTSVINWSALATSGGARVVGEVIRNRWGIWCGVLGASGDAVPLGLEKRSGPKVCVPLMARQDGHGSCGRSVRRWASWAFEREEVVSSRCHAGLSSVLLPLRVGKEVVGTLFASGFFLQEDREAPFQLQKRQGALSLSPRDRAAQPPTLSEADFSWLKDLLQSLKEDLEIQISREHFPREEDEEDTQYSYRGIIGRSAAITELFRVLKRVSVSDSTVLIQGENGTGKELIARAIHENSRRADQPFVIQNCSALNDNLLDSELFGHKKGAFTGAASDKPGLFDLAHGGTFFLDEVGDMSPTLQVKMLRVLQEGTFLPVGDTVVRKVDVRVIAATNRDLKSMVAEGTFREDLYYRLNVINLVVPPLRERRSDISLLAEHFLRRACETMHTHSGGFSPEAIARLEGHAWPGNVRELENEVERLLVLAGEGEVIREELLSHRIRNTNPLPLSFLDAPLPETNLPGALESLERRMILEGLRRLNWNKTRTAQALGISRRNLIRKVNHFQLDKLRE